MLLEVSRVVAGFSIGVIVVVVVAVIVDVVDVVDLVVESLVLAKSFGDGFLSSDLLGTALDNSVPDIAVFVRNSLVTSTKLYSV